MRELELLTLASQDYFESLSRFEANPAYRDILRNLLPEDWNVKAFDLWLMGQPNPYELTPQGFKIHVSATRRNAEALFKIVIPECVVRNIPFKIVADPRLLSMMNSKNFSRGSSGKSIVIYPKTLGSFKELIERLYELTQGYEGPYILSDRRYKDSKVIYYRYGGFRPTHSLTIDGRKISCIQDPDGNLVPDERLPYFKLPAWVADPFAEPLEEAPSEELLNGRYQIEGALTFSNAGGVYKALDTQTGQKVVLKEARPLTNFWIVQEEGADYIDAAGVLGREFRVLDKLKDCPGVVKAIELFQAWEHFFLVEEEVEGIPLTNYRAREDFIVITLTRDEERKPRFCKKFRTLARQLIKIVLDVHSHHVVLGDVSSNNFMVDPETLKVTLIDLETAIDLEAPNEGDLVVKLWSTPGFRRPSRLKERKLSPEDDLYALGMILYSLLAPIQQFFELEPKAKDLFLDDIARTIGLPAEVGQTISLLLEGRAEEALEVLDGWEPELSLAGAQKTEGSPWEYWGQAERGRIASQMQEVILRIASFLLATYDTQRQDRFWPADFEVFNTNPLSVAFGACGPLLFLKETGCPLPEEILDWVLRQDLKLDNYPPGLYWGLAGVACTLGEIGLWNKAREALDLANKSPLRFAKADMFHGASGWGWANLWFHSQKGDPVFLDHALEAGEHLLASAESREPGCCWRNPFDGLVHHGFAYGASGVALFLLHLYQVSGDPRFLALARRGLDFELANAFDPANPALKWFNNEAAHNVCEPYWEHGSAGIGSVFIRFAAALGERYQDVAQRAGEYAFCKFAVHPAQFSGLSGIGEFMLDLFLFTGREIYLNKAYAIASTILQYAVERPQGIAFPGRYLLRLSNDFSTGSAGIGLFFDRLLHLKPRHFLDLDASIVNQPRLAVPAVAEQLVLAP